MRISTRASPANDLELLIVSVKIPTISIAIPRAQRTRCPRARSCFGTRRSRFPEDPFLRVATCSSRTPLSLRSPTSSDVDSAHFQVFVDAAQGKNAKTTHDNAQSLELLCREFKFLELHRQITGFLSCPDDHQRSVNFRNSSAGNQRNIRRIAMKVEGDLADLRREHEGLTTMLSAFRRTIQSQGIKISSQRGIIEILQENLRKLHEYVDQTHVIRDLESELETQKTVNRQQLDKIKSLERELLPVREQLMVAHAQSAKKFVPCEKLLSWENRKHMRDHEQDIFPPLKGIIRHLKKRYNGNVHDCGAVVVSSSRPMADASYCCAKNVVDLKSSSFFWSAHRNIWDDIPHSKNKWLCYEFRDRKVIPSHYAIRTNSNDIESEHLRNWAVEGSRDGETWVEIDRREDNGELNGYKFTATFSVSKICECRMVRIANIGKNWVGSDALEISAFEIFGALIG